MASREPRDLVGDPNYYGVDQPGDYPEFEGQTPTQYHEHQTKWREWAAKQQDKVADLVTGGARQGLSSDQALSNAGFYNEPDQGKYMYTLYGNNGLFATQGAAVDPNLDYDWGRGIATWKAGTDNAGQSRPINATEREEYGKAQKYQAAGLQGYGQQNNASLFNQWGKAHFEQDPKTGLYFHKNNDGTTQYVDQYGRPTDAQGRLAGPGGGGQPGGQGGPGGYPPGVSSFGDPGGGQGGGQGGNPYPNYTPGSEALNYSSADVNSALAEQMRNDVLSQQLSLQKGLEGHAMGQGIYNYLLNDVYGKVLGVNFQGNQEGVSNYARGLNGDTGDPSTAGAGPGNNSNPGYTGPKDLAYGDDARFTNIDNSYGNDGIATQVDLGYGDDGIAQQVDQSYGNDAQANPAEMQMGASSFSGPVPGYENPGGAANPTSGGTTNGTTTASQVPANQTYTPIPSNPQAAKAILADLAAKQKSGQYTPDQVAGAIGHIVNALGPSSALAEPEARIWQEIQNTPGFADIIRNPVFNQVTSQDNTGWSHPNENLADIQQKYYPNNMTPGGGGNQNPYAGLPGPPPAQKPVNALGKALPTGTYTQTGTQSLDPNMSSTWAQFLAPTWNKVNEASQQQLGAISRMMPRGGQQDKAKTDAVNQRYSALQSGWQGLVPGALQGISDIGKEMYFQQMTPYSGAASTMQQGNIAGMQNQTALTGIKSNEMLAGNQLGENARQFNAGQKQNQGQFDATMAQQKKNDTRNFWGGLGSSLLGAAGSAVKLSDSRVKKNVSSFAPGLAAIRQLDPVAYEYNGKGGTEDGQPGISVMAQQLEKAIPSAVQMVKTPDGFYRAIDPMAISMASVNAIKELDKRISSLAKKGR